MDEPRILIDTSTGRPILVSPIRLLRPHHTGPDRESASGCPFCEGNESATTKECDAVRRAGTVPDTPGWTVRAFPNLYPAAAHHDVIAEGAAHTTHPGRLPGEVVADALTLCRRRITAMETHPDIRCALWFKNVGAAAGASIAHNHSQVLGLPMLPPRLETELRASQDGDCLHCAEIVAASAAERIVWRGDHHVILTPRTPKLPFETWLLPLRHDADFLAPGETEADLARAVAELFRRVDVAFPGVAFNTCLHRAAGVDLHWHFELQPRIGNLAALELFGDMYINSITPAASTARWRGEAREQRAP